MIDTCGISDRLALLLGSVLNFVGKLLPTPAEEGSLSTVGFCKLESHMPRSRSKGNAWAREEGLALAMSLTGPNSLPSPKRDLEIAILKLAEGKAMKRDYTHNQEKTQ